MRHRFAHEVAALHALDHPGVVPLLDSWISPEGEPCLAMQFLDGPTLRHVLKEERRLDPVRVARIVEQLGDAVGAIHQRGIVHRDLKPENLIVLGKGEQELVVVIDFGTSAARGPENEQEHTTTLTGSLHYLAPERLAGQYSPASDVYSIAVMVLEMVTGMRPAEIDGPPGQPEFLQAVGERTGRAAEKIALALQHQPGRRPPDASAWAGEVAKLLRTFSESRQDGSPST